ncbi:MAG: DUF3429 domain-containing protein [Aquincola sp.]|nr:DUF3429 domain-containing protein [Aquincola sp.]MDH5331664.1 DUF3429 domain-containing protein [Aquincola sp.]
MPTLSITAAPSTLALRLGYAGLLPFVAGAALAWLAPLIGRPAVGTPLLAYAAAIVSFLGGIHWGLALRDPLARDGQLLWGVTPSLVAWGALLVPTRAGLVVCAAALLACYLVDRRVYQREGLGAWLALRWRLTAIASLSCLLAAGAG